MPYAGLRLQEPAVLQALRGRLDAQGARAGSHRVGGCGSALLPAATPSGPVSIGPASVVVAPGATTDLGTAGVAVVGRPGSRPGGWGGCAC